MKFIKSRKKFLNEAKIRDVILPRQAKEVKSYWGEKFLDYEEVTPTNKIIQGKWKLSEEDKMKVLGAFFSCDMEDVYLTFKDIPDKFVEILSQSIDPNLINDLHKNVLKDFNIKTPTIDQIVILHDNIFRKIAISETISSEYIQKDERGRPMKDDDGNMIKIKKNIGDVIFSSNLVNINTFLDDYNRCYPDNKLPDNNFGKRSLNNLRNAAKEDANKNFKVDFEIFNKDIYLSITHNAKDILNMSISKFYASCQHLYNGGYRGQLLSNVFDPNSIPAFLTFETPIFWDNEKISEHLPLSRMVIRSIESFEEGAAPRLFFDRAYPDRMKDGDKGDVFTEIVEKYSGNKHSFNDKVTPRYTFTPDIDTEDKLEQPYMDRLGIDQIPYIGKNTKILYLNRINDWSKCRISPDAKIKELIIETTEIPEDLFKIKLTPDWIKFKYLTIKTLKNFDKIKTDLIAFDKCKFDISIFEDIKNTKKLQIVSCDVIGNMDFSNLSLLEELHIIYTLNSFDDLKNLTKDLNIKKLVISGDLVNSKDSKIYLNELKRKMKIEIIGPVI